MLVAPKVQIGPQLPADLERLENDNGSEASNDDEDEPVDRSIYRDPVAEEGAWYEDGAYIAYPDEDDENALEDDQTFGEGASEKAIHDAYFASILRQYTHLRTVLAVTPTEAAAARLPPSTHLEAGPFGRNSSTTSLWSRLIRTTDPHPVQLAIMTKDSILRVLRVLLGGKFLRRGHAIDERTSRWLWSLLARMPDRGELNHTEIGWVRDLGRRAVLLGRSLAEMAALRDELHDGGLGVNEAVDGSSSDEEVVADSGTKSSTNTRNSPALTDPAAATSEIVTEETKPPDDPDHDNPEPSADEEDGEVVEEDEDVAMEIASNSSLEEGEADDDEGGAANLEDAKARLLAQLDESAAEQARIAAEEAAREREQVNMRATLNMILTVAGEFYGQRDLLEFREPFVGM